MIYGTEVRSLLEDTFISGYANIRHAKTNDHSWGHEINCFLCQVAISEKGAQCQGCGSICRVELKRYSYLIV